MSKSNYIKYIYFGILALLIAVSVAAYWNQQDHTDEIVWVRHSNRVLRQLELLLSTVKDAETGHRGYQLTRDSSFLQPYFQSVASLEPDIRVLDSLLLDRTTQKVRKDSLKDLIARQYRIIDRILSYENESSETADSYKLNLLKMGRDNMNSIRSHVKEMKEAEEDILKERLSSAQGSEEIAPITLLIYAFLALSAVTILFFFLSNELSRRRAAEDELRLYTNDLKRSNEDLEQFAYVASHDLQEPLRKIRAFGDRLQSLYSTQLDERGKDYIERMQGAAKRMQILIDDLLSFSRISRGISEHEDVDLNKMKEELEEASK